MKYIKVTITFQMAFAHMNNMENVKQCLTLPSNSIQFIIHWALVSCSEFEMDDFIFVIY